MTALHSPTPYSAAEGDDNLGPNACFAWGSILDADGLKVCRIWNDADWNGRGKPEDNAAFIVRACNAHDDLVAALREIAAVRPGNEDNAEANRRRRRVALAALAKAGAA